MVDTLTATQPDLAAGRSEAGYRGAGAPYALDPRPAPQNAFPAAAQPPYTPQNYFHQQQLQQQQQNHFNGYYGNQQPGYPGYYGHNGYHQQHNTPSDKAALLKEYTEGPKQDGSPATSPSSSSDSEQAQSPPQEANTDTQPDTTSHTQPEAKPAAESEQTQNEAQTPSEATPKCEVSSPAPTDPSTPPPALISPSTPQTPSSEAAASVDSRPVFPGAQPPTPTPVEDGSSVKTEPEGKEELQTPTPRSQDPNAPLDPNAPAAGGEDAQEDSMAKLEAAVRDNLEQAIKQHNQQRSAVPPFLASPRSGSGDIERSRSPGPIPDADRSRTLLPGNPQDLFGRGRPPTVGGMPHHGMPSAGGLPPPGFPFAPHLQFPNIFQRSLSDGGFRPGFTPPGLDPFSLGNHGNRTAPSSLSPPTPQKDQAIPPSFPRPPPSQPLPQYMPGDSPHKPPMDYNKPPQTPGSDSSSALSPGAAGAGADHRGTPGDDGDGEFFYCHLCSYVGTSKSQFNVHMNGHFEHACPQCDYTSRTEGRLKRHIKDFHSDDDSMRREPGRPKSFRCRQCDFVAKEKEDYWAHARTHIKDDKVLQCPKCPFVTEYKHHLEYHLRNHFGSKPFKCTKCNYSCVNKSMLNSHMKSHTNVYQYRCADCTYATKYCHSLKLHLTKYNHSPAVVLNPDGSLPTDGSGDFELVSKRGPPRGPRGPRKSLERDLSPGSAGGHHHYPEGIMMPGGPPIHPGMNGHGQINPLMAAAAAAGAFWPGMFPNGLQPPPPLIPMNHMSMMEGQKPSTPPTSQAERGSTPHHEKLPIKCKMCDFPADSRPHLAEHMIKCHGADHRDIQRMFAQTHAPQPVVVQPHSDSPNMAAMAAAAAAKVAEQQHLLKAQQAAMFANSQGQDPQAMAKAALAMMNQGPHPFFKASPGRQTSPSNSQSSPGRYQDSPLALTPSRQQVAMAIARKVEQEQGGEDHDDGALDLTNKNEMSNGALDFSPGAKRRLYEEESLEPIISHEQAGENSQQNGNSSPPKKRSRKGKAYKLDVLSMKLQDRYSTASPGPDFDYSDNEDYPASDDYPSMEDSNDGKPDDEPDYSALHESIRALNSGVNNGEKSPLGQENQEVSTGDKMLSGSMNRKKVLLERHQVEEEGTEAEATAASEDAAKPQGAGSKYECQHCDIAFRDCIMYTMHMGYHGYHDPFKCNMCGQTSRDRVEFFLHIARTAHE